MLKAVRHLAEQLTGIRSGTLSVGFVQTFRTSLRGNSVAIGSMASVTSQGDRIVITPFDPANVPAVVKALADARMNAYALDPRTVCLGVPPISGEQRAELAKHVKKLGEEAKVAIRSIRQDARKEVAARGRGSERVVQEATDAAVEQVERLVKARLNEIGA
ncbi:MAG: ribosome recycling factor [Planctomycetota bacterium]|nr:ribosome recycling factor [Planctomycetota bacterium]